MTEPFAYDVLAYPSPVIPAQSPNHLAAAGLMFGWQAPDPATASVLEIGCGDAFNLIACAAVAPHARHVGFDLSAPAIETGRRLVEAAALRNVELSQGDILTWPLEGEQFDYIVAHGVYAWVPEPVREALMRLIGARLKPGGIGYVSYDCLPGSAPKQAIVAFLQKRVARIPDVQQRIDVAHELVRVLAAAQPEDSRLKLTLDALLTRMEDYERSYFLHDWLCESYGPASLEDFARMADRHGLAVVGDASCTDLYLGGLDDAARNLLAAESHDAASHGFALDMLRGNTSFRRTLVTRRDALLPVAWDGIKRLHMAFLGARQELEDGAVRYSAPAQVQMTARVPAEVRVLDTLFASGAEEMTLDEIVAQSGEDEAMVTELVRQAACIGLLEINATAPPYTLTPSDRPRAGNLVRALLIAGDWTINLRHYRVTASSQATRLLIILCDGKRDHAEIARVMSEELKTEVPVETVSNGVEELAQQYLFES